MDEDGREAAGFVESDNSSTEGGTYEIVGSSLFSRDLDPLASHVEALNAAVQRLEPFASGRASSGNWEAIREDGLPDVRDAFPFLGWTLRDERRWAIETGVLSLRQSSGTDKEPRDQATPPFNLRRLKELRPVLAAAQGTARVLAPELREAKRREVEKAQHRYLRALAREVRGSLPTPAITLERWRRVVAVYGYEGALVQTLNTQTVLLREVTRLGWLKAVKELDLPIGMEYDSLWQALHSESLIFERAGGRLRQNKIDGRWYVDIPPLTNLGACAKFGKRTLRATTRIKRVRVLARKLGVDGELARALNAHDQAIHLLLKPEQSNVVSRLAPPPGMDADTVWLLRCLESRIFFGLGMRPKWCRHGDHWYIARPHRQDHCFKHGGAGRQKAWRDRCRVLGGKIISDATVHAKTRASLRRSY